MVHTLNQSGITVDELRSFNLGRRHLKYVDDYTIASLSLNGNTQDKTGKTWVEHGILRFMDGPFPWTDSVYFPIGNDDAYLSITSDELAYGAEMTIDFWAKINNIGGASGLFGICPAISNSNNGFSIYKTENGKLRCSLWNDSFDTSLMFCFNRWCHYAFVYKNGTWLVFINGALVNSIVMPINLDRNKEIWIGKTPFINDGKADAVFANSVSMANVRVSKEARWTSDFVPSQDCT